MRERERANERVNLCEVHFVESAMKCGFLFSLLWALFESRPHLVRCRSSEILPVFLTPIAIESEKLLYQIGWIHQSVMLCDGVSCLLL